MDPYVCASLMPNSIASAKTEVVTGGGTEPDWDGGKGHLLELIPGGREREQAVALETGGQIFRS